MRSRLNRLELRRFALFVAVAATVAVVTVLVAREAGVDDAPATAATPPLRLQLSAPEVCEVQPPFEYITGRAVYDRDGRVLRWEDDSDGWSGGGDTTVTWVVSGGTAPYTLEIDGLQEDGAGKYEGATGTASVSYALQFETPTLDEDGFGIRYYPKQPVVDSGTKTIMAVVTDASGRTAKASVRTYAVLAVEPGLGTVMRGGETYRMLGMALTIPDGMTMIAEGVLIVMCAPDATICEDSLALTGYGVGYRVLLGLGTESGTNKGWSIQFDEEDSEDADQPRGSSATAPPTASEIDAKVGQFFASLNRLPTVQGE